MAEIEQIAKLQKKAWDMADIGVVPTFETKAVSEVGFVYIAITNDQKVIGFIYGYHQFPNIHYSHMLAVLPEWQHRGIGYNLKKYHREQILVSEIEVKKVQWTVDPLLPNNAYLNFAKLGGYCDTYKVDYYGSPDSDGVGIYAGVPTDRFLLTWPIHDGRVERRMKNYKEDRISINTLRERSPLLNSIKDHRYTKMDSLDSLLTGTSFSVEVPANYHEIRSKYTDIANEWRVRFREICLMAFDKGFRADDYHSIQVDGTRRNFYEFSCSQH